MGFLFSGNTGEPEEITCRVCGIRNKAEYDHCTNCGHELARPRQPRRGIASSLLAWLFGRSNPPPPDRVCPSCGEVFPPTFRYCGYDGSQLDSFRDPAIDLRLEVKMLIGGALSGLMGSFVLPMLLTPSPQTDGDGLRYIGAFIGGLLGMAAGSDSKATSKNLGKIIIMLAAYFAFVIASRFFPILNGGH